jgi:hypothetical protein
LRRRPGRRDALTALEVTHSKGFNALKDGLNQAKALQKAVIQ